MTPEARPTAEAASTFDPQRALAQHGRWLRTVVLSRVGEPQAVDEVLQEVSLAAVRQAAELRSVAEPAPWLYRLAVTQSLLFRRRAGRSRKLVDRFAQYVPPGEQDAQTPDPLAWLLADEERQLVRVALGRLPRRDAEVLLLKYTEDWTYHDLARHLGVSHSAVEARLHRARARLRSELAALEIVGLRT